MLRHDVAQACAHDQLVFHAALSVIAGAAVGVQVVSMPQPS